MARVLVRGVPNDAARERGIASLSVARVLGRAIYVGLLALVALTAIPYGTVEPWWESLFECAVFLLAALWMIEGLFSGRWFVSEHRLLIPVLAVVAFALFQSLPLRGAAGAAAASIKGDVWQYVSADPYQTRLVALKILALGVAGALFLRYTSSLRRLRALTYSIIGVAVVSALFGMLRQTRQHEAGFVLPYLLPGWGYGQFINKNHFAYLMEMALGLLLGLAGAANPGKLIINLAVAAPVWTALVLSNSRAGIFGMLCQLFAFIILFSTGLGSTSSPKNRGRERNRLWRRVSSVAIYGGLAACLLAFLVVAVVWTGGDKLVKSLEAVPGDLSRGHSEQDRSGRREIWWDTVQLIKAHPVAGVGFGGYWIAIHEYRDASGEAVPQQAHNDYLELLASGGLVAAALGGWFVAILAKTARRQLKNADPFRRAVCLGALLGILAVSVHSLFDYGLHVTSNALTFTALLAVATVTVADESPAS